MNIRDFCLSVLLGSGLTVGGMHVAPKVQKPAKARTVAAKPVKRAPQPVTKAYTLPAPSMALLTECPLPSAAPHFSDSAPLAPFGGALVGGVALSPSNGGITAFSPPALVVPPPFTPAVPEPDTWGLLILGFGCVGLSMRRKKSGFTQ